jgi:hypothetical protein
MAKPKQPKDDDAPAPYKIDILGLELESGAPHWLNPVHSHPDEARKKEIRDAHYAAHIAELKSKKKPAAEKADRDRRWRIAKRSAEAKLARAKAHN